ncbi:YibE/F family protein [Mitsuokella jalaludinii]|uniref:YibE/F family protein n=2 Tax=Mitsuokella jalaludinii TaxID=187979 RepID=UPI003077C415
MHSQNPDTSARALFKSGMRVGQDVMGTMAATLILAVFGGSLGTWVLDYVYDLPFLQLLNSNSLDIVIMQGLSSGIGGILTVPIAAGCSAFLLAHKRASVHETSPFQIG